MSWLTGSDPKIKRERRFSKPAMEELEKMQTGQGGIGTSPLYQAGSDWIMRLLSGDTSLFDAPLMQQFEQKTVPQIAERFGGMGAGSSSALNQTLAQAGQDLTTQIANVRANLMNQLLPQGLNYAQQPYSNQLNAFQISPYQMYQTQGTQGMLPGIMSGIGGAIGGPIGAGIGNYASSFIPKSTAG